MIDYYPYDPYPSMYSFKRTLTDRNDTHKNNKIS